MSDRINEMFSRIAENYDRVNRIISLGTDLGWRRAAARACLDVKGDIRALDVATGTADQAIFLADEARKARKRASILGVDFNKDMLAVGRRKLADMGLRNVRLQSGDAMSLRVPRRRFNVVTSSFGVRNFDDPKRFVSEAFDILAPGGKLVILEASKPGSLLRKLVHMYYFIIIPAVGSRYDADAYAYLSKSMWNFDKPGLIGAARDAGFEDVRVKDMMFGAVFIMSARKPRTA